MDIVPQAPRPRTPYHSDSSVSLLTMRAMFRAFQVLDLAYSKNDLFLGQAEEALRDNDEERMAGLLLLAVSVAKSRGGVR